MVDVPSKIVEAGHEQSDLSPKMIGLFAATLVVIIIAVLAVGYALFQRLLTEQTKSQAVLGPLSYSVQPSPEPHLEVNPGRALKATRSTEDALLQSYGWVDREKGTVHLPIDRAIELLAERGLPARHDGISVSSPSPSPTRWGRGKGNGENAPAKEQTTQGNRP